MPPKLALAKYLGYNQIFLHNKRPSVVEQVVENTHDFKPAKKNKKN